MIFFNGNDYRFRKVIGFTRFEDFAERFSAINNSLEYDTVTQSYSVICWASETYFDLRDIISQHWKRECGVVVLVGLPQGVQPKMRVVHK